MDGKTDVSDGIQRIIDENPNRTIYFPDVVYLLSKPILTPAHPHYSVDLQLSNFAVLKAAEDWVSDEAMVRLGATHPANEIFMAGNNYSFTGGIVDGSGKASGISIDGGRETAIRNVAIKHTRIGIHIKHGANNGSSDADVRDVNIIGTGKTDSVGVLMVGYDNTLTNMRIANVFIGVHIKSGGNILRSIHPLYTSNYDDYQNSCGFRDERGDNWYNVCYSDHFGVGYCNAPNIKSIYDSCYCMWYIDLGQRHTAFRSEGQFQAIVTNLKVGFCNTSTENVVLDVGEPGGKGVFDRLCVDPQKISDHTFEEYLVNGII